MNMLIDDKERDEEIKRKKEQERLDRIEMYR